MGHAERYGTDPGQAQIQAQSPSRPTFTSPATLLEDLEDLRYDYDREAAIEINAYNPPVTRQLTVGGDLLVTEEPGAAVGMSLSAPMIRLLGHHEGYGLLFSVRRALHEWERYCRAKHQRWPDHIEGPRCSIIAWATVRDKLSLWFMAEELEITYPRAERMLAAAITWIRLREMLWEDAERSRTFAGHDRSMCAVCRAYDAELA